MDKYIPDVYQKSIYTINYDKLYEKGIRCLLYDLDNTLVPIDVKTPNDKLKKLFKDLQKKGFRIIIFSNCFSKRLNTFKKDLKIEGISRANKPSSKNFIKVIKKYNYKISEVAIIGDQILTDIKGGNNVGITTVLVNQVGKKDFILTKINRLREKKILKKMDQKGLFVKGRYYE